LTTLLLAILFAAGIALVYDGATRPALPTLFERRHRWTDNAEAFLRRAGLEGVSVREFALISAGAGVSTGLLAQLVLGWLVLSVAVGGLGLVAPLAYFGGALVLNDRVGGKQVGAVLDRLAEATRAELAVEQEAKARQGQVVLSARVVALVPAVVLVGLRLMAPTFTSVYDGPAGQIVLVGCFLWVLIGYAAMLWMGRLPHDRRVLVR
jgi:Flp pilus assembly protein TadB